MARFNAVRRAINIHARASPYNDRFGVTLVISALASKSPPFGVNMAQAMRIIDKCLCSHNIELGKALLLVRQALVCRAACCRHRRSAVRTVHRLYLHMTATKQVFFFALA